MYYVTIKDENGYLRPLAYIDTLERHLIKTSKPQLDDGEVFVVVTLTEADPDLLA